MNTDEETAFPTIRLEEELAEKILAPAFKGRNTLDAVFLEKASEDML